VGDGFAVMVEDEDDTEEGALPTVMVDVES